MLDELDERIRLDRLKALHINDSQVELGSNRDRHASLGDGLIGERLSAFLGRPRLQGLPAVLETGRDGKGPDAQDMRSSSASGVWASAADVRVAVVDPQAYTLPYDDELCRALGSAGAEVELLTAHFTHGSPPVALGYTRREIFGPPLAGLLQRRPTTPARVPLKLGGHAVGLARLIRRVRSWRPDVVHWQWAPLPALDLRALRAAGHAAGATVFTAHDVLPRRSRDAAPLWAELYASCDRVIVHGAASRDRLLVEVGGIAPERIAVIPHAILHAGAADGLPRSRRNRASSSSG